MSDDNYAEDLEKLLADNDVLRKSLVKVSFTAVGVHKNLDYELQNLRKIVRSDANIDEINQQVEAIARVLMTIDDAVPEDNLELSTTQIFQGLLDHLSTEFPEMKDKFSKVINVGSNRPFFKTLVRLAEILPQHQHTKPQNFFSRLFSFKKPSLINETFAADSVLQIQRTLLHFLEQLTIPEKFSAQIGHFKKALTELDAVGQVPDLMNALASLVLDIKSEDKIRFELFLNELNQRLDIVQDLLQTHADVQDKDHNANKIMDTKVRAQVQKIHKNVHDANDINELQHNIEDRLEQVISNLDLYQEVHEQFVQQNQEKMSLLNNQLNESRTDINDLHHKLQKQQHLAETDSLTKLPNRYAFQRKINDEYMRWRRYRHPLTLAIADIDFFKKINDTHGHSKGDEVLTMLAEMLQLESRETDFVARYGGEEFVIILPETHLNQATKAVNKIRLQIASDTFELDNVSEKITLSVGVAEFEDNDTIEDVVNRADTALYRAKEKGRNVVCCELKNPTK